MATRTIEPLDSNVIEELKSLDGDEFFAELVESFYKTSSLALKALELAVERQEPQLISRYAHSLRGCSANIGAILVTNLSKTLESQGKQNDLAGCLITFPKLRDEYHRACHALEHLIAPVTCTTF